MDKRSERPPVGTAEIPAKSLDIETPPASLSSESEVNIGDYIVPQIMDLDSGKVRLENGVIQLDQKALNEEEKSVEQWLIGSVQRGEKRTLEIFLRNIDDRDEGADQLRDKLQRAFEEKDENLLRSLGLNNLIGSIAERNMLREYFPEELERHPFTFLDDYGEEIDSQYINIVFTRDPKSNDWKFIIGSKKGIASVAFDQNLSRDKYEPDMKKAKKDKKKDILTFVLQGSKDGHVPSVPTVEVRKGYIDLVREIELEIARKEEEERRSRYSPPPPKSYSGESRYVSYSNTSN